MSMKGLKNVGDAIYGTVHFDSLRPGGVALVTEEFAQSTLASFPDRFEVISEEEANALGLFKLWDTYAEPHNPPLNPSIELAERTAKVVAEIEKGMAGFRQPEETPVAEEVKEPEVDEPVENPAEDDTSEQQARRGRPKKVVVVADEPETDKGE